MFACNDIENFELSDLDQLIDIFYIGMDVSAYITELYTVLRIFKNEEITNCIIYVGEKHLRILYEYFNICKISFHDQKRNSPQEIRCVKNAVPFIDFFTK
jgi:hypothetical protein